MSKAHRFLISMAILGTGLLAFGGCNKKDTAQNAETKASASATPVPKSAEPNSFEEVAAQLDRGGSFYIYLSTEQWLTGLSNQITNLRDFVLSSTPAKQHDTGDREKTERAFNIVTNLVKESGLEEITGLGASSFALEPGLYRNKVFVHHYKDKRGGFLWSAFGKAPHRLNALDLLPADTALASFADVDLAQLVGVVRQEIESGIPEAKQGLDMALMQFSATAGISFDEVLQSLGGSMGIIVTLDASRTITLPTGGQGESIPAPRIAILWQVKDDRIFKQVEKAMGQNPALVRVDEPDLRMRTMLLPPLLPMELRPTAAQWGNYLIVASDDKLIRDIVAAQKDGKGLKSTPEFARLAAGLPEEGNGFQITTQFFADTLSRLQSGMIKNQPGMTAEQLSMMQKLFDFQKPAATYSVSTHLENGWLLVGKGKQGASQIIAPALVVPAAIVAGVALPAFSKARDKAKATKSLNQARQIGLGCKLYAADNGGKFPPTLEALVPEYVTDSKIFISPFAPEFPMGYDYTAGLTEESPSDKVLIEDRFASGEHQRVVVRVDISGEVTSQP